MRVTGGVQVAMDVNSRSTYYLCLPSQFWKMSLESNIPRDIHSLDAGLNTMKKTQLREEIPPEEEGMKIMPGLMTFIANVKSVVGVFVFNSVSHFSLNSRTER